MNQDVKNFYEHEFDFDNQTKDTYDDWLKVFSKAIKKRAVDGCFMGLSSGYDSGVVSNELLKQGVKFKTYTIRQNENNYIIDERLKKIKDHFVIDKMSQEEWRRLYDYLDGKINPIAMKDIASPGVAYMFESAQKEGRTICICCQGGDEIIADYALFPGQSTFKGVFPEKLYEWKNFKGGMNEEYINEIEDIAKIYNIECRYPFLDIDLVQEFLWLTPELKNRNYKAPEFEYLTINDVPFIKGIKSGFHPI